MEIRDIKSVWKIQSILNSRKRTFHMESLSFKAVIFDLDGVITDTSIHHLKAWDDLARSIGIQLNGAFLDSLKGIDRMQSLEAILKFGNLSFDTEKKLQLAAQKNTAYLEKVHRISPSDLLPGAQELLEILASMDMRIGLASSSKNAPLVLEKLKITSYFECIVDPAALKKGKPDPEIFLKAAAGLGVTPEKCIGIEDAAAGVTAINAAGMFSIGIGSPLELKNANLIVPGLDKLNESAISSLSFPMADQ